MKLSKNKHLQLLLIAIFFICIFAFFLHPFEGTGDFYHHVNTGSYIVKNHQFPNLDTYSFTAKGKPWVAHSWGSGLIFFALLSSFGQISITLFNALVATLTLILLYLLLRSYGPSKISSLLTVGITAIAFSTRFPQRPEIFAYPFVLLILLIDAKRKTTPYLIFFLPIIIFLWANMYGSAVLFGIGLVGILAIKQFTIDKFKLKRSALKFYILCLASIIAAFINPYTYKTVFYFYLYIPKVSVYEGEWAGIPRLLESTPIGQLITFQYFVLIYFIFAINLILLLLFSRKILKKFLFQFVMSLTIFLPFFAFRTFPLAAILCAPIISICIEYVIHKKAYAYLFVICCLTLMIFYYSIITNLPKLKNPSNMELNSLTQFIHKNSLSGNALNLGHFGGYITYEFYPSIHVFFDTRDELYLNSQAIKDLYSTYNNNQSVIPLLKKYNVDLVIADFLTDGMNYRDLFYSLEYIPVYLNDRYFIVVPKKIAKEKNLPTLTFLDPFSKSGAKPGYEKQALNYYQQLIKENPNSLNNRLALSSILIELGKFDDAIKITNTINVDESSLFGPLQARNKSDILAQSYMEKNDCINTKKYLELAQKPIGNLLIFKKNINNLYIPRALPFYYLLCENDYISANQALQEYIMTLNSPLEKIEIKKKFDEDAKRKDGWNN